jgi:hypothetical protein
MELKGGEKEKSGFTKGECMKSKKQPIWEYRLIDNNWTRHPVAYCKRYQGYLTEGLIKTHKCRERNCKRLQEDMEL